MCRLYLQNFKGRRNEEPNNILGAIYAGVGREKECDILWSVNIFCTRCLLLEQFYEDFFIVHEIIVNFDGLILLFKYTRKGEINVVFFSTF